MTATPLRRPKITPLPPVAGDILLPQGTPEFGAFAGSPTRIGWDRLSGVHGRGRAQRFLRHKRWMYVFTATDDLLLTAAIVDAGPTGTAFVMVTDRATGEVLADTSRPGATGPLVGVNDRPVDGHRSHYAMPGTLITMRGDTVELRVQASLHAFPFLPVLSDTWVELDLRLVTKTHPELTAVTEIAQSHPMATATVKNAALPTTGQVTIRRDGMADARDLTGFGGFDYTSGFLPRHTAWRWAFLTGLLADGRPFGVNLVAGFSGIGDDSHENTAWLNGTVTALDPAARIEFGSTPADPWRVTTTDGAVDLTFTPLAEHHESLNLGAIRSTFRQPCGHFSGTVRVGEERVVVDAMPGVVEDQDVLW